jgi:hypothetical protein
MMPAKPGPYLDSLLPHAKVAKDAEGSDFFEFRSQKPKNTLRGFMASELINPDCEPLINTLLRSLDRSFEGQAYGH